MLENLVDDLGTWHLIQDYTDETGNKYYNVTNLLGWSGITQMQIVVVISGAEGKYVKMDQIQFRATGNPVGYEEDFTICSYFFMRYAG